jgi:hypothetical protein
MSAFTVALAIGENGGEGRMSVLLFSALALATLTPMATVAPGFNTDPSLKLSCNGCRRCAGQRPVRPYFIWQSRASNAG